jgi:hypothetical protein
LGLYHFWEERNLTGIKGSEGRGRRNLTGFQDGQDKGEEIREEI